MQFSQPHRPGRAAQEPSRPRGFTLVELVMVLAIAALMLALAAPSFSVAIERARVAQAAGALLSDLQFARAEAQRRGTRVTVCAAATAATDCSARPDWTQGWLVVLGAPVAGTPPTPAELLRSRTPWDTRLSVVSSAAIDRIGFDGDGFVANMPPGPAVLTVQAAQHAGTSRCVVLWVSGRLAPRDGAECNP